MNTCMNELTLEDMEMVNGGGLASTLLRVAGGVASFAAGMVTGPAGAIVVGLAFAGASIAVDECTNK